MKFNTIDFVIFFPLVCFIYYRLKPKLRNIWLLAASVFFYMYFIPYYVLVLGGLIVVDFFAAKYMEQQQGAKRKRGLLFSILSTCLVLFVFKYFNFFMSGIIALEESFSLHHLPPMLSIALPIGLSFHTFQSLSYVIEVYRGNQKTETNFLDYSLYVMFFPQLVAGPIERPGNLLHQFKETHQPDYDNFSAGTKQMLRGFFKKMVIADNISPYADAVFNHPAQWHGNATLIGCYMFAIQIYCDFSGYSDIAIGAAKILGFRLMKNFDFPYMATSLREFWRKWHISLSTWFRDYLYIPIVKNKTHWGKWANVFAVAITFTVSGLWHGANITFVLWGLLHGILFSIEFFLRPVLSRVQQFFEKRNLHSVRTFFSRFITFNIVCFLWIFFRSKTLDVALTVIKSLAFNPLTLRQDVHVLSSYVAQNGRYVLTPAAILTCLAAYLLIEWISRHRTLFTQVPRAVYLTVWCILIGWILLLGNYQTAPDFIYFQF